MVRRARAKTRHCSAALFSLLRLLRFWSSRLLEALVTADGATRAELVERFILFSRVRHVSNGN